MLLRYHPARPVDRLSTDGMDLASGAIFAVPDERARALMKALPGECSQASLSSLDRQALDERARALGVSDPARLKSKPAVIAAIEAALSAPPKAAAPRRREPGQTGSGSSSA